MRALRHSLVASGAAIRTGFGGVSLHSGHRRLLEGADPRGYLVAGEQALLVGPTPIYRQTPVKGILNRCFGLAGDIDAGGLASGRTRLN